MLLITHASTLSVYKQNWRKYQWWFPTRMLCISMVMQKLLCHIIWSIFCVNGRQKGLIVSMFILVFRFWGIYILTLRNEALVTEKHAWHSPQCDKTFSSTYIHGWTIFQHNKLLETIWMFFYSCEKHPQQGVQPCWILSCLAGENPLPPAEIGRHSSATLMNVKAWQCNGNKTSPQ